MPIHAWIHVFNTNYQGLHFDSTSITAFPFLSTTALLHCTLVLKNLCFDTVYWIVSFPVRCISFHNIFHHTNWWDQHLASRLDQLKIEGGDLIGQGSLYRTSLPHKACLKRFICFILPITPTLFLPDQCSSYPPPSTLPCIHSKWEKTTSLLGNNELASGACR